MGVTIVGRIVTFLLHGKLNKGVGFSNYEWNTISSSLHSHFSMIEIHLVLKACEVNECSFVPIQMARPRRTRNVNTNTNGEGSNTGPTKVVGAARREWIVWSECWKA